MTEVTEFKRAHVVRQYRSDASAEYYVTVYQCRSYSIESTTKTRVTMVCGDFRVEIRKT